MERFEYHTSTYRTEGLFNQKIDFSSISNDLNMLGGQGWELVSSFTTDQTGYTTIIVCVFKRRLIDNPNRC